VVKRWFQQQQRRRHLAMEGQETHPSFFVPESLVPLSLPVDRAVVGCVVHAGYQTLSR